MINPHELRLGNFIKCLVSFGNQQVLPVYGIGADYVTVKIGICYQQIQLGDSESITLTPEVLEKCGHKSNGIETANYVWIVIHAEIGEANIYNIYKNETVQINIPCKYLHQLQNLYFTLTGEELTYKP